MNSVIIGVWVLVGFVVGEVIRLILMSIRGREPGAHFMIAIYVASFLLIGLVFRGYNVT